MVGGQVGDRLRFHVARADRVHRDVHAGHLFGEGLCEADDASLGCGVVGLPRGCE